MKKKKPKILISTPDYRIVQDSSGWRCVETEDGHDRMGVRRWKDWSVGADVGAPERFRYFVNAISDALELRAKRRRASR